MQVSRPTTAVKQQNNVMNAGCVSWKGHMLFVWCCCPPVPVMNLTQKRFAEWCVWCCSRGLLLCRSHNAKCRSSEPDTSREPGDDRRGRG
jgi:hypothetical protein